ncbi:hypothetical protein B0I08_103181 [Glaciihabitans tibetensis]|uniref:Anti-sigma-K factor rskA n=1 Tax=Glaciihabitans tibetensis TaxID=1266600 RepID=A0A2T0VFJ7_9MICO|nr:hypothetical protein [Glaciihabitans tibetensis]PRY68975.1 hypothetical protein B0I08_103181 [Glaciihabitans tibetensis]
MPDASGARRAFLISGAITGELTTAELAELDTLRAADPTVEKELRELTDVARVTSATLSDWDATAPSKSLRGRVLAIERDSYSDLRTDSTSDARADSDSHSDSYSDSDTTAGSTAGSTNAAVVPLRRRPWLLALGAAACIVVGAGGTLLLQPSTPSAPTGPPGTLGAIEQIAFTGEPSGVSIDGSLVAHTWGTETLLTITGLTEADPYDVVLVTLDGASLDSGSFLGSAKEIDCAMNAAVMREAVTSVQIQDASGAVVASAELPAAS